MKEFSRERGQPGRGHVLIKSRAVARGQAKLLCRVLIGPLAWVLLSLSPLWVVQAGWAGPAEQIEKRAREALGFGTAFAIRPEGLFMTNLHVVEHAKAIGLSCPGIAPVPARVVTFSSQHDLAVLRANVDREGAYLIFANPKTVQLGEEVFTVGYPAPTVLTGQATYGEGAISGLSGPRGDAWLEISIPILPGSSGSPVLNEKGEVVGIVVATDVRYFLGTTGSLPQNIGWAVKAQYGTALFQKPPPETGEAADPAWLVGTWEGQHAGRAIRFDLSRFEFTEEKGELRWTMQRHTAVRNWAGNLRASGVVRAVTDSTVELGGTYDTFSQRHTAEASLNYRLKRRGNTLQGSVSGAENASSWVSLKRVPAEHDRNAAIKRAMEATCLVIVER